MQTLNQTSEINLKDSRVKGLEILSVYHSKNFDAKKKLNAASNIKFDAEFLNEIEKNGLTYEQLSTLKAPVFKYQTQITVHGIFQNDISVYGIGGFKNLIINKNRSLGIRYNAIDYAKKNQLHKLIEKTSKVGYTRNSTENYFSFISRDANEANEFYNKVNTDLFLGTKKRIAFNFWGVVYYIVIVNIFAFPIENLNLIAENLTGLTIDEIKAANEKFDKEQAIRRDEMNRKFEQRKVERENQKNELIEKINQSNKEITFNGQKDFVGLFVTDNYSGATLKVSKYIGKRGAYHTVKTVEIASIDDTNNIDFDSYRASKFSDKDFAKIEKFFNNKKLFEIK